MEMDGEWYTFFRTEEHLFVAELKKDRLGYWYLHHPSDGDDLPISGTTYHLKANNGVIFDSIVISQSSTFIATYYYGMIENDKIKSISIESAGELFENIPLYKSNDKRFFLFKKKGEQTPYTFKGYDLNGNVEVVIEGH